MCAYVCVCEEIEVHVSTFMIFMAGELIGKHIQTLLYGLVCSHQRYTGSTGYDDVAEYFQNTSLTGVLISDDTKTHSHIQQVQNLMKTRTLLFHHTLTTWVCVSSSFSTNRLKPGRLEVSCFYILCHDFA